MDESDKTTSSKTNERRGAVRLMHSCMIKAWHPSFSEKSMKVRDFSDSGAFLICDWTEMPPLGSVIEIQVQDLAVTAPRVKVKLIRFTEKGVGVTFCDE